MKKRRLLDVPPEAGKEQAAVDAIAVPAPPPPRFATLPVGTPAYSSDGVPLTPDTTAIANPLESFYNSLMQVKVERRKGKDGKPLLVNGEARYRLIYWFDNRMWYVYSDQFDNPLSSEIQTLKLAALIDEEISAHKRGQGTHNVFKYQPDSKNEWAFTKQFNKWLSGKEKRLAPSTFKMYSMYGERYLTKWFGLKDVKEIKMRDINNFLASLPETMKPKTKKNIINQLATFLNHCVDEELIARCPKMPSINIPETAIRWADWETQNAILAQIEVEHAPIIHCGLRLGVRIGELLGLQVGDIDFKTGTITIQRQIHKGILRQTKTGKIRVLPIHPELRDTLKLLCTGKLPNAHVFMFNGKPYNGSTFYKVAIRAAKKCGITISAYQLTRHSMITQAAVRNINPLLIQQYAGHTSMKTTMRYTDKTALNLAGVQTQGEVVNMSGTSLRAKNEK